MPDESAGLSTRPFLECAGRAERRRRFCFREMRATPWLPKAASRCACRRTPKGYRLDRNCPSASGLDPEHCFSEMDPQAVCVADSEAAPLRRFEISGITCRAATPGWRALGNLAGADSVGTTAGRVWRAQSCAVVPRRQSCRPERGGFRNGHRQSHRRGANGHFRPRLAFPGIQ